MRVLLIFTLALVAGGVLAWQWFENEVESRAMSALHVAHPDVVEIIRDSNLADLLAEFDKRGYTEDGWWIRRYAIARGFDKQLKVGEFRVLPGDSASSLLRRIVAGEVIRYRFTIVEGMTLDQVLGMLGSAQFQRTKDLTAARLAAHLHPPDEADGEVADEWKNLEGWFLPATYDYVRSDRDIDVLHRAHVAMQGELDRLWQQRSDGLPYTRPYEALIMASIIEKETGVGAERPLIASVFVRRLKLGMRLQTDPTVIYGIGTRFDGNLTRQHLETPTRYNTYTNNGLPPTPIAMPGLDALRAAMQPAQTDHLYFVGRGDGTSKFSRTLAEHNKAVDKYQRTSRPRGVLRP